MRAYPFGTINGAFLERGIDVAARDLLRYHPDPLHNLAGEASQPEFQTLEIVHFGDLLTEPAAHLRIGIATRHTVAIEAFEEFVQEIQSTRLQHPGILHAAAHAEGQRRAKHERVIFAEVVVKRGMTTLDSRVLDRIDHLKARNDFAAGKRLDLKLVVGQGSDTLAD